MERGISMKKTFLRIITLAAVLSVIFAMVAVPAAALSDTSAKNNKGLYLQIDGIDGESKDSKHGKWIDVIYFRHASAQSIQTGSPDAAGRGIFEPFVFRHYVDKATPNIQKACMEGRYIKRAQIDCCCSVAGRQEVVYTVYLEGVKIVKAEVEVEELPDGDSCLVETVYMLVNKQTWTESATGMDNALGGKTESSFDQSKKASMFDSNTSVALTVACAVIFVLIVVIVILVMSKKKKAAVAGTPVNDDRNE